MTDNSEQTITLSVEEAARLLGISPGLAYELVHRGEQDDRPPFSFVMLEGHATWTDDRDQGAHVGRPDRRPLHG